MRSGKGRKTVTSCAGARRAKPRKYMTTLGGALNVMTNAWGVMEKINGTPLPFAYVALLRPFLRSDTLSQKIVLIGSDYARLCDHLCLWLLAATVRESATTAAA